MIVLEFVVVYDVVDGLEDLLLAVLHIYLVLHKLPKALTVGDLLH